MSHYLRNRRLEATAVANAAGRAVAVIENMAGPSFDIQQISVSVLPFATSVPSCSTYIGRDEGGVFISSTLTGDSDTDSFPKVYVKYGESLCAVWSNAALNAVCKMTVVFDESPD